MALVKVWRTIRQYGLGFALKKVMTMGPRYVGGMKDWRVRRCRCCEKLSLFMAHANGSPEFRSCMFCSANERYELLAAEIRGRYGERLRKMDVLELDEHSPLRTMLSQARKHTRTFYDEGGAVREMNGAVMEDITGLSFADGHFDLIVSSDVLEHVPALDKAFRESARVLRPGGAHLFTVPPREATRRRAEIADGAIRHIAEPEYHLDPLSEMGILAFWDIGPDLGAVLPTEGLSIGIVRGPVPGSGRVVWMLERLWG